MKQIFKSRKLKIIAIVIISLFVLTGISVLTIYLLSPDAKKKSSCIPFLQMKNQAEVDSLLQIMTIAQKAKQVILYQNTVAEQYPATINQLSSLKTINGIDFRTDSIADYIHTTNKLLHSQEIPPFLMLSTSNGRADFIKDLPQFPSDTIIEAANNDSLINDYAGYLALQCKLLGINLSITPNITSCYKKETSTDTLYFQYVINRTKQFITALHKNTILAGMNGNQLMHKNPDAKDEDTPLQFHTDIIKLGVSCLLFRNDSIPAKKQIQNILFCRQNLDYKGLIISTPLDTSNNATQAIVNALGNGADIILIRQNPESIINSIIKAIENDKLDEDVINEKVKRILLAKQWIKQGSQNITTEKATLPTEHVIKIKEQLCAIPNQLLNRFFVESSVTVLTNEKEIIPFQNLQKKRFYTLTIGKKQLSDFNEQLQYYSEMDFGSREIKPKDKKINFRISSRYNTVILALNQIDKDSVPIEPLRKAIEKLSEERKVILVNFGNPQLLKHIPSLPALLQVYDTSALHQCAAAQILFGGIAANGMLPFSINNDLVFGQGIKTQKTRLKYTIPEEIGIRSSNLQCIDSIALSAINQFAFPGCQVFVAKEGKVIFNKCYGYLTYDKQIPVQWNTLYDIASVSKIAGATMAAMKMFDRRKISLKTTLEQCFDDTHIEYTRIKPDTIVYIDTLNINTEMQKIKRLLRRRDTLHINDTTVVAYDTLIFKLTPKLNIFKSNFESLLRHQSGIIPSLPVLPLYLYRMNYDKNNFYITENRLNFVIDSLRNSPYTIDSVVKMQIKTDTIKIPDDSICVNYDSLIIDVKNTTDSTGKVVKTDTSKIYLNYDTTYFEFDKYYSRKKSENCTVEIAKNFFIKNEYFDTLWIDIKQMPVYGGDRYQYTDVNMILVQQAIDSLNNKSIAEFLSQEFFKPLGLQTICYQPLKYFPKHRIAPTEDERIWRIQQLHGYVHDPSAAFLGGISGNAGVFSNAHDLGVLFQMVLNKGIYGNRRFLNQATIELFTKRQKDSERGLGFDMPGSGVTSRVSVAPNAPRTTYGHGGFTGACVWNDPENEIVYVFLSNRVYPSSYNYKINRLKVRQGIHQAVYDALKAGLKEQ